MSKYLIGLTGGIGSGKTETASYFSQLGVSIVDADQMARVLLLKGTPYFKEISHHFGPSILDQDGTLNRAQLRHIIFSIPAEKQWIEQLLHPPILKKMMRVAKQAKSLYCILVIPLLFESQLDHQFNRILVIDAPQKLRIQRVQRKNGSSIRAIQKIIQSQVSRKERLARATDMIHNRTTIGDLHQKIQKIHQFYLTSLVESSY